MTIYGGENVIVTLLCKPTNSSVYTGQMMNRTYRMNRLAIHSECKSSGLCVAAAKDGELLDHMVLNPHLNPYGGVV